MTVNAQAQFNAHRLRAKLVVVRLNKLPQASVTRFWSAMCMLVTANMLPPSRIQTHTTTTPATLPDICKQISIIIQQYCMIRVLFGP